MQLQCDSDEREKDSRTSDVDVVSDVVQHVGLRTANLTRVVTAVFCHHVCSTLVHIFQGYHRQTVLVFLCLTVYVDQQKLQLFYCGILLTKRNA